ncbi:MAG: hypothetical protein GY940_25765 [bacterium]|nr:hypothetical protein [bacterium]
MQFKMGSPIPDEQILKRFEDEDGEIFLELRGQQDSLFRVTEGNRFYYKIEKENMGEGELHLLEDYSHLHINLDSLPLSEQPTAEIKLPFYEAEPTNTHKMEVTDRGGTESGTLQSLNRLDRTDALIDEWSEGQWVPNHLHMKCTKNDYGGYTLRHNKFIYLLDNKYKVEIKTPDTASDYQLETESLSPSPLDLLPPAPPASPVSESSGPFDISEPFELSGPSEPFEPPLLTPSPSPPETPPTSEFKKGDILPLHYRELCEEDIGPNGGSQVSIGGFLYFLDGDYKILQKMKIAYLEGTTPEAVPTMPPEPSEFPDPFEDTLPPPPQLSVKTIVSNMVKTVQHALQVHGIDADYFKESVLAPANRDTLIRAYNGDMAHLNDDTREAAEQGKLVSLHERGTTLFKAVMIHELYIKSTLKGRGDKMKYFLTFIIAAKPDGTPGTFRDAITPGEQKEMLKFLKGRAEVYTDKAEIILRVYRKIRHTIMDDYEELLEAGENVRFDAFMIAKIYENTTRLDRIDGISLMRLTRAILKFNQSLNK